MPSGNFDLIIKDLKAHNDVTARLKSVFSLSDRQLSNTKRLDFIKSVLTEVQFQTSQQAHDSFLLAIASLRRLVPSLLSKQQSLLDTNAKVERYAVNHASAIQFPKEPVNDKLQCSAVCLVEESLRILFESRGSVSRKKSSAVTHREKMKCELEKENNNPQFLSKESCRLREAALDRLIFEGASLCGMKAFLPKDDNINVSSVISSALIIKLSAVTSTVRLPDLLAFAQQVVVPWARCSSLPAEPPDRQSRKSMNCIQAALFSAARLHQKNDPCTALRVRAYALTLGDITLKQYAKELLRSVHALTRANTTFRCNVFDIIGSVYDEALHFTASFSYSDRHWFAEDVSAWLDHVGVVSSQRSGSSPTPAVFEERIGASKKTKENSQMVQLCEFQLYILRAGLYGIKGTARAQNGKSTFDAEAFLGISDQLLPFKVPAPCLFALSEDDHKSSRRSGQTIERSGLHRLRLLRILEPIRRSILASARDVDVLPKNVILILETYISAVLAGLKETRTTGFKVSSEEEDSIREIRTRIGKMCEAAFEAAAEVARVYFEAANEEGLVKLIRSLGLLLNLYAECSREQAEKRRLWICGVFRSELGNTLEHIQRLSREERYDAFCWVASVGEECEQQWCSGQKGNVRQNRIRADLLLVVRGCHTFLKNWSAATRFSIRRLNVALNLNIHSSERKDARLMRVACSDFVEDLIAFTIESETDLFTTLEPDCPIELLLSVVMDYCTSMRLKLSASPGLQKYHNVLGSLRRVRALLLDNLKTRSSEGLCLQRELHATWLSLVLGANEEEGKFDCKKILSSSCSISAECRHSTRDITSFSEDSFHCSIDHRLFVQTLFKSVILVIEGDLTDIGAELKKAERLLCTSEFLRQDLELLHISSEILQWVESVAALFDLRHVSDTALALWQTCNEALGVPTTPSLVANHCHQLAQLGSQQCVWTVPGIYRSDIACGQVDNCRKNPRGKDSSEGFTSEFCSKGTIDFVDQLDSANKELKSSIVPFLRRFRYPLSSRSCNIAGVDVEVNYDIKNELGRDILQSLLLLIRSLHQMGRVLLLIENLTDGRYYLERCHYITSQCLPPRHSFCQYMSVIYPTTVAAVTEMQDILQLVERTYSSWEMASDNTSPRSLFLFEQAIALAALESSSNRFTCSIDNRIGAKIMKVLDECKHFFERMTEEESHLSEVELSFSRGLIHTFVENYELALEHFLTANRDDLRVSKGMVAVCSYFLAKIMIMKGGGLHCALERGCNKKPNRTNLSKRITRSQRRKEETARQSSLTSSTINEVHCLLKQSIKYSHSFGTPRLERRIWNLQGFTAQLDQSAVYALQKATGLTFNIRWSAVQRNKANRNCKESALDQSDPVEELGKAFQSIALSHRRDERSTSQVSNLLSSLEISSCVVAGLSIDETRECLSIWRIGRDGIVSHRVRLPKNGEVSFSGILKRISDVISQMKEMSVKAGCSFTEEEKHAWWNHRYSLDRKVKEVVMDIEAEWLGEFKKLLVPFVFSSGFLATHECPRSDAKALVDLFTVVVEEGLLCDSSHDGTRMESKNDITTQNVVVGQLVLIVDTILETIPWESLPVLRDMEISVTRTPSLAFLDFHLNRQVTTVDSRDLMYVINPTGDLQRTEDTFREHHGFQRWTGFFGKTSREEVEKAYKDQRIYLYCGHGAGSQYFSPRRFSTHGESPIALLMGCSSARPSNSSMGDCESNGAAVDYLVQGSRAVVGNLWDVGDRDIDRFTMALLSNWLGVDSDAERQGRTLNLAEAIAKSRSACRLPFLVGAATVVIGAPNIRTETFGA